MSEKQEKATDSKPSRELTRDEAKLVARSTSGSSRVIHEIVRLEGDDELDRPALSLALSGFAAGCAISASIFAMAAIGLGVGDQPWAGLVSAFGYAIGFIIVVMGQLQLFTETTITAVLPIAHNPSMRNFGRLARLWAIVLLANLAATLAVAAGIASGAFVSPEMFAEIRELSSHLVMPAGQVLLLGIPAGFLVAAIAWILPNSRGSEPLIITVITWMIAAGGFTHVIASSTEIWVLVLLGDISLQQAVGGFLLPALAGNVIGGTGLFTLLAHGQVRNEL